MPKPTNLPRWDSTEVNLVEPPSGVLDIGWETGGLVVSSFFNWYQNLVYQWLVYLDSLGTETQTRQISLINARPSTPADWTFSGNAWSHVGNNTVLVYPVDVTSGDELLAFVIYLDKTTSGATEWTFELFRVDLAGAYSETVIASTTNSENAPGATTASFVLSEVTTGQYVYYLSVRRSAGAGTGDLLRNVQFNFNHVMT